VSAHGYPNHSFWSFNLSPALKTSTIVPFAVLTVLAMPAWAQTPPREPTLPTVTVKEQGPRTATAAQLATGLAATALDTPFSIDSVPGDRVREQAGTTLQDALRNVPGAQADSGFNGSHTQFFILRGAVVDNGTGSNRVLRDGARLSNYPYVPAFVERVDVMRGPGAAVGVRSEPGGTVNIVTRTPQMSNFGSVLVGAGSANARELSVDLNRVLSQENELAARLVLTRSDASEWRHVKDQLEGLQLGIAQSDGNRYHLRARFEATNQTYQPDYGLPSLFGRPVAVPLDRQLGEPFGDSTTNNRITDLHGDFALSEATRLSVNFTHLEAQSTSIKNLLFGNPLSAQPVGTWARVSSWEPGTTRRIDSLSTALTSAQTWGGVPHQLHAGVEIYRETLNQPTRSVPGNTSPPINVFNPVYGLVTAPAPNAVLTTTLTTQDLDAVGLSLQDRIELGDWSLVAGLRLDRQTFLYGTAGTLAVKESRWSPKLALLRRIGETDTVYASLSTGLSPNQVASSSNRSLPSRRSAQAELGWKSVWQGGRLTSEVALFQLDQSNMISSDLSTANNFDFTVSGEARSRGLEASLTGALTERLEVVATYAYTEAAYGENAVYGYKQVPNVARHALSLWGQYRWSPAWKTGAGLYVQSRRFAEEANTTVLPGYARVDLTQTWSQTLGPQRSLEVQFALRNLFDKAYFVSSHLHVARWITPGQGRNAALTATYRY
jgi:iron complex outermembrane receptor protein